MGFYMEGPIHGGAYTRRENCCFENDGLIHGGAYTRRGLFSEFYGIRVLCNGNELVCG